MEGAFNLLKSQGKNNVDGVLQFLREKNVLDNTTETVAKEALSGLADPNNITLETFTEICALILKEKGSDIFKGIKSVIGSLLGPSGQGSSSSLDDDSETIHHEEPEHGTDEHDTDEHGTDEHDTDEHDDSDHSHQS